MGRDRQRNQQGRPAAGAEVLALLGADGRATGHSDDSLPGERAGEQERPTTQDACDGTAYGGHRAPAVAGGLRAELFRGTEPERSAGEGDGRGSVGMGLPWVGPAKLGVGRVRRVIG